MRNRPQSNGDRTMILGMVAATAAGMLVMLGTVVTTALWPLLSRAPF